MDTSTYIALSGQNARQQQMDVLANNIANMSTPGFKAERMMFQEYVTKASNGGDTGSYVKSIGNVRDMSQGPIAHTGNPLDVAINGDGFLTVSTAAGTRYTRNGHLSLDTQRELITTSGNLVQNTGGAAIVIPQGAGEVSVSRDGTVSTAQGTIGKIAVVNFDNPQVMQELEQGLYTTDQTAQPAPKAALEQGAIEESNVQSVLEMTKLMENSREVTNAKNFTDGEHNRIKDAIDRLGKSV
jgi:flagellar basal-body rod protein FlgF